MYPLQRVARFAVIKLRLVGHMPAAGGMTVLAIVPQFPFVKIRVTTRAIAELQADEFGKAGIGRCSVVNDLCVALCTRDIEVFAVKRVLCFGVIETGCRFPG